MAQTLETLIVQLQADVRGLKTGLDSAVRDSKTTADRVERNFDSIGASARRLGPVIASGLAAGVGAITALGAAAVASGVKLGNYADKILDLEQQTGLTTDRLQQFELVARTAGVPVETLANQALGLTRRLRGAGDESKLFSDNLAALGISTRDANGELRSTDELLPEIIRALSGIESITERNAVAFQVFGRQAEQLAPVLALGADEIERLSDEAMDLGQVLDRDTLNAANDFRIEFENLNAEIDLAGREIAVALLPALTTLARVFREDIAPVITRAAEALGTFINYVTTSKTDRLVTEYEKLRAKAAETADANSDLADELERVAAAERDRVLLSLNEDARRVALEQVQLAERLALAQETVLANERIAAAQQARLEQERQQAMPIGIPELERNVAEGLASVEAAKTQLAALEALAVALEAEAKAVERTRVEILRPDVVDAIYGPATDAATSAADAADNAANAANNAADAANSAKTAAENAAGDGPTEPRVVDLSISPSAQVNFSRALANAMSEALVSAVKTPGVTDAVLPRAGAGVGLPEFTSPQGLFDSVPTLPTVQGVIAILDEAILSRAGDIGVGIRDEPVAPSTRAQILAGLGGTPGVRAPGDLSIGALGVPMTSTAGGLGVGLGLADAFAPIAGPILDVIGTVVPDSVFDMQEFAAEAARTAQGLRNLRETDLRAAEELAIARDRFLEYQNSRLAGAAIDSANANFFPGIRFENLKPLIPVMTPDGPISQEEAEGIRDSADALEAAGLTAAENIVNGVVAGIQSGDISSALQGIFDALGSYAAAAIGTAIGGPAGTIVGILAGGLISGVGRAATTQRPGRSERAEAQAVAAARVPSAIRIDFTFNQSNSLGLIDDPSTRRKLADVSNEAFQRFEDVLKRNLVPRLEALEGRVFA